MAQGDSQGENNQNSSWHLYKQGLDSRTNLFEGRGDGTSSGLMKPGIKPCSIHPSHVKTMQAMLNPCKPCNFINLPKPCTMQAMLNPCKPCNFNNLPKPCNFINLPKPCSMQNPPKAMQHFIPCSFKPCNINQAMLSRPSFFHATPTSHLMMFATHTSPLHAQPPIILPCHSNISFNDVCHQHKSTPCSAAHHSPMPLQHLI